MKKYYVDKNARSNGDHEVHHEECIYLPLPENRAVLGNFTSCADALAVAKEKCPTANGCIKCSKSCYTS